ncbi:hypothetical protein AMTRI_Chr13g118790 [Amborella trichopoda]
MGIAEMRILRWMSGKTRRDRIRNDSIQENLGVTPTGNKMRESRFRWAGHVWCRPSTTPVRRCELVQVEGLKRARGRPKRMWLEVFRKDMATYGVIENTAFNGARWRTRILVTNPN